MPVYMIVGSAEWRGSIESVFCIPDQILQLDAIHWSRRKGDCLRMLPLGGWRSRESMLPHTGTRCVGLILFISSLIAF